MHDGFRRTWIALAAGLAAWAAPAAAADWDAAAARTLIAAIGRAEADGLDPADYGADRIAAALAADDAAALARAATDSYRRLAADLAGGRLAAAERRGWHIAGPEPDPAAIDRALDTALAGGRIAESLAAFAPRHPHYRALRAAYAATPAGDAARRETIRVNLERWRWLPRAFEPRHVFVNIPGYSLELVEDGRTAARHRLIVGKPATPTPRFRTVAGAAIVNPWWNVPASIVAESVGALVRNRPKTAAARGYRWTRDAAGRLSVRQAPGPGNALGRMKLDMPNPFSIFIHDTPAQALFARPARAFSHGCLRVENALDLAAVLTGRSRGEIDAAVAGGATERIAFPPLAVYVVYLTAVADAAGTVALLPDIYGQDAALAAALADQDG
jgi:murein L,D-transpeptidase YcbB/YkuD